MSRYNFVEDEENMDFLLEDDTNYEDQELKEDVEEEIVDDDMGDVNDDMMEVGEEMVEEEEEEL